MQMPDDALLCAFADGELEKKAAREIEALAAQYPAVRERIEMFRRSAHLVRFAFPEGHFADIPPDLQRQVEDATSTRRVKPRDWARQALVAAVLVFGIAFGATVTRYLEHGTVLPRSAVAAVMYEVAEYHPTYARETEHLVEVPASRREHIEQWLGARVGLDLKAPDLTVQGLTFRGARLVPLEDQVLAQLMYTDQTERRIALCVTKLVGRPSDTLQTLVDGGLKLHGVSKGQHIFLVVGPEDSAILDQIADQLPTLLTQS